MTIIALQAPLVAPTGRPERPALTPNALPLVQTVAALPNQSGQGITAGMPAFRDRSRESFTLAQDREKSAVPADSIAPQPFPALRFADPLPDLPELDLPAKNDAYRASLTILRSGDKP